MKTPSIRAVSTVIAVCLSSALVCAEDASPRKKPNILIILADDLGYGDVQCYNPTRGKIPTPHIDRLAAGGMCSPTGTPRPAVAPLHATRCLPVAMTCETAWRAWASSRASVGRH
jgi:hypothetical protein